MAENRPFLFVDDIVSQAGNKGADHFAQPAQDCAGIQRLAHRQGFTQAACRRRRMPLRQPTAPAALES